MNQKQETFQITVRQAEAMIRMLETAIVRTDCGPRADDESTTWRAVAGLKARVEKLRRANEQQARAFELAAIRAHGQAVAS